jgi:hypothetical protein
LEPVGAEKVKPFRPRTGEDLDEKILEQMENVGIDRKSTIQAVLTGKFNQAAGLYYMYAFQKQNGVRIEDIHQERIEKEESVAENKGENISDELAQVLCQFERTRETVREERESTTLGIKEKDRFKDLKKKDSNSSDPKLKKLSHVAIPKRKITNVVPLPDIPHTNKITPKVIQEEVTETIQDNQVSPSKFGIPSRNAQKPIPIDDSLYMKEEDVVYDHTTPRTIKFAFNCICHTKLSSGVLFEKLSSILDKNDVVWYNDKFLCACEWGDIKFEVEICKLPRLTSFGIRIKRNSGDIWDFKKLSTKITQELEMIALDN